MRPRKIWILVDHDGSQPRQGSLECIELARSLRDSEGKPVIEAVLLGQNLEIPAAKVVHYGVDRIIAVENSALADYTPDTYVAALEQLMGRDQPSLLLMVHSYQNMDLAPRLAARLPSALVTDCVGVRLLGDDIQFTRQMFRNKLNVDLRISSQFPWMVTIQQGAFAAPEQSATAATIETREVDLTSCPCLRRILESFQADRQTVDLSKAEVVIGVGRGVKKQEKLELVAELARSLRAELGASRPIVDNGWLARERQIGSSGQNIAPKLYFAVGISGAIQHVVGIKNSQCIVAINSDSNAPIFNIATYGIVGDWEEIVPLLTERLRDRSRA